MHRLLAALVAAFFCLPAFAGDLVGRQGDDSVRLTEAPCTNELVLGVISNYGEDAADYRAASAQFQGKAYQTCWRMMDNVAFLRYEDGDAGIVLAHELKPALDI